MNGTCGAKFSPKKEVFATTKVGNNTTRLLDDKCTSSYVPWLEIVFEKSFQSSRRHVGKICCCASQPANPVSLIKKSSDDLHVSTHLVESVVRKTCGEQRFAEILHF